MDRSVARAGTVQFNDQLVVYSVSSATAAEGQEKPRSRRSGLPCERPQRVESVRSTLRAVDIRPLVGGANGGLSPWMTAALPTPIIDAAVLLGEPMTASRQAP